MSVILKMLGAENEEQAVETLTKLTNFLTDVRAATGTEGPTEGLAAIKAAVEFRTQAQTLLGKDGPDALKVLREQCETVQQAAASKSDLDKVLAAIGETSVDAAIGSIATAKSARDEHLPKATQELADMKAANEKTETDSLLAKLKGENRISPSQEEGLWPTLSLEGKRAFAKTAVPINGAAPPAKEPGGGAQPNVWNGKTYSELSYSERATLKRESPELFKTMRAAADEAAA